MYFRQDRKSSFERDAQTERGPGYHALHLQNAHAFPHFPGLIIPQHEVETQTHMKVSINGGTPE